MSDGEGDGTGTQLVAGAPADPLVGILLKGRYEILEPLGQGGMASVYFANDRDAGQKVVLKVPRADLARELGQDMQLLERFETEVGAQASLEHKHIVRVRDRGRVEIEGVELPFVVVDFKGGGDLEHSLRKGLQTPEEVLGWLKPVAQALDFSHERGWIHRDIKPDNILFDDQGYVYLSDFGIAKLVETGLKTVVSGSEPTGAPRTQQGFVLGAPGYIPPEAISGDHTHAYDQYSLGVVVAQALSGERPSAKVTVRATESMLGKIPKNSLKSVRRALSPDPEDRFPSCIAFFEALEAEVGGGMPIVPIAGGVVGLLAVAAAGWWMLAPPTPSGRDSGSVQPPVPVADTEVPAAESGTSTAQDEASGRTQAEAEADSAAVVVVNDPVDPLLSAPRTFEVGSTSAEVDQAMELCESAFPGCQREWYASESPTRRVTLEPFVLDPREVTVADFRAFVGANSGYRTLAENKGFSAVIVLGSAQSGPDVSWRETGWEIDEQEPVVHIGRDDADAYCAWQGKRLPTADEWEAVARGQERRIFPWGDQFDPATLRWSGSGAVVRPAAVAQFPASPEGYWDLAGNVWEWTMSEEDGLSILKGGSWADFLPSNMRAAAVYTVEADYTGEDAGFRCATSVDSWPGES